MAGTGQPSTREQIWQRILLDDKVYPPPEAVRRRIAAAREFLGRGDSEDAAKVLEYVFRLRETAFGVHSPTHPDIRLAAEMLTGIYTNQDDPEALRRGRASAEQVWRELAASQGKAYAATGTGDVQMMLYTRVRLMDQLTLTGRPDEVSRIAQRTLPEAERRLGSEHELTGRIRLHRAQAVLAGIADGEIPRGQWTVALEVAEQETHKEIKRRTKVYGRDHPATLDAREMRARILVEQGHRTEAAEVYRDLVPAMKNAFTGDARSRYRTARNAQLRLVAGNKAIDMGNRLADKAHQRFDGRQTRHPFLADRRPYRIRLGQRSAPGRAATP
ncbi:hypothetical protein [Marinactinospora rubrisoli]|uniref:Tetratricopeptide repeat protein n=1 Tax=Marinactinospora rubrisoli TaxID=2715399 RepID=A0ABW2KDM6_9ACTN